MLYLSMLVMESISSLEHSDLSLVSQQSFDQALERSSLESLYPPGFGGLGNEVFRVLRNTLYKTLSCGSLCVYFIALNRQSNGAKEVSRQPAPQCTIRSAILLRGARPMEQPRTCPPHKPYSWRESDRDEFHRAVC